MTKVRSAVSSRPKSAKAAARGVAASGVTIVGIGASAGGLEALEQLLTPAVAGTGLAFVIVQHLDPTHADLMVELLQRITVLPVVRIVDRMQVLPDHVYVIPPNRDLSVLHGVLHLLEPSEPRGLRLPIDLFFRALAVDQQQRAIAVVLSGMGSDGTLGLRAIKEQAGAAFVQDPADAASDGMPRSAINAGLADVVAPASQLLARICAYHQHLPQAGGGAALARPESDPSDLDKVVLVLRAQTGHDFSLYKKSTLLRRIERRLGLHQLASMAEYLRYLRDNPQEGQLLFKELLIGVTSFFRDPPVWERLKSEVLPALLAAYPNGGVLRAWTPACSTGEEAYSLAIIFHEALVQLEPRGHYGLQLFATDLDHEAVDKARAGVYPEQIAAEVSAERLQRFFVRDERGYRVSKAIREMVIFAPHNLVMDPPFTKLDLITCRNLLIYLEADLQQKLLPLFHYSLNPGGVLVLGTSETVGQASELFAPLPGKAHIFRRQEQQPRAPGMPFPAMLPATRTSPKTLVAEAPALAAGCNLQALTEQLLLRLLAPAAVLTTARGDLVYVSGKTGKYLEPAAGKANLNLLAMARDGLAGPLNAAFTRAVREHSPLTLTALTVAGGSDAERVDISLLPLTEPPELRGMVLVVFTDVAAPAEPAVAGQPPQPPEQHAAALATLMQELRQAQDELQILREEMQSSQEELRSTNEELQSTNEELQSTNEELTTSKEEMQSMNEELQTVNHELSAKVEELSQASDDMKNLLNSTEIATLFLDEGLKVRRFTTQTTRIIKLIPGDAGRPITDLATELDYPGLADDARNVLNTLVFQERQVVARDGRWFKVRIMPYRTQANHIDGVVITFVDISDNKRREAAMAAALTLLNQSPTSPASGEEAARLLEARLQQVRAILAQRVEV